MLFFGQKMYQVPNIATIFPLNPAIHDDPHNLRQREMLHVNHARTFLYLNTAIPAMQRRLNKSCAISKHFARPYGCKVTPLETLDMNAF